MTEVELVIFDILARPKERAEAKKVDCGPRTRLKSLLILN